jgi:hypothetical protein
VHIAERSVLLLADCVAAGARRLLRWEQRMVLGLTSGQVVTPAETKVKLSVSAAELQQETRMSEQGLQYMLAVAGSRCAYLKSRPLA